MKATLLLAQALTLTTSLAALPHVFSTFGTTDGAMIGGVNFDTQNMHCFWIRRATRVSFTQWGMLLKAKGPFCLKAYADAECGDVWALQQFDNVEVYGKQWYALNEGLCDASSYSWEPQACPSIAD